MYRVFTKKNNLTKREDTALRRIYGDGDYRMVTTRPCVKQYNQRRKERRHANNANSDVSSV